MASGGRGRGEVKKLFCLILLLCLLGIVTCSSAFAFGTENGDVYILKQGEVHKGDLAVSANKAVIEGTVDGDLYVFSESVEVIGEVKGDVISFAANTTVSGKVDGNIRAFTQRLTVAGEVTKNVTAASQHFLVIDKGQIGGSTLLFAANVDIAGTVGKEANGFVQNMRVTGTLNQGIKRLSVERLVIDSSAVIRGDIVYSSNNKATISPEANISGKEFFTQVLEKKKSFFLFPTILLVMSVLSTIIFWLLIRYLFPVALVRIHQQMAAGLLQQAGLGLLLVLAAPIIIALLLLTIVGIPISLALGGSLILLLCIAKIFVGSWAGLQLAKRFGWRMHPMLAELVGLIIILILTNIPFLGWLLSLGVWSLFLGAMVFTVRQTNKKSFN